MYNNSVQFSSIIQLCPTLCDPMDCSMPGFPVHHQLPELAQTHNHQWHHPTISFSVVTSSWHQYFPVLGSFLVNQLFTSGGQNIGASALTSNEYSGLISFRMDLFDLLAVQGTLKSLLQDHDLKASVLQHSAFFSTSNILSFEYRIVLSHIYFNTILHNMDNHCH